MRTLNGGILLTGAAGFAGRAIMDFLEMGPEDAAADLTDDFPAPRGVRKFRWELPGEPEGISGRFSYVVHLAALTSVADSLDAGALFHRVNVMGTEAVIRFIREHCPDARLLFVSSSEIYAPSDSALHEGSPAAPVNPYGESKLKAEELVRRSGLDWVISRSFPHFGPGQRIGFVLPSFCARIVGAARAGEKTMSVGNLRARRDYLYIADVVRAYLALLEDGEPEGIYNVCSGEDHSIGEILDMLLEISGAELRPMVREDLLRSRDQVRQVGDPGRLESLGWRRRVPLKAGLDLLYKWWEERI